VTGKGKCVVCARAEGHRRGRCLGASVPSARVPQAVRPIGDLQALVPRAAPSGAKMVPRRPVGKADGRLAGSVATLLCRSRDEIVNVQAHRAEHVVSQVRSVMSDGRGGRRREYRLSAIRTSRLRRVSVCIAIHSAWQLRGVAGRRRGEFACETGTTLSGVPDGILRRLSLVSGPWAQRHRGAGPAAGAQGPTGVCRRGRTAVRNEPFTGSIGCTFARSEQRCQRCSRLVPVRSGDGPAARAQ
jgi:hypothetical protein